MRRWIQNLLAALLLSVTLSAADTEELTQLIRTKVDYITEVLGNKALSKEAKNVKMTAATDYLFDYALMARLSLGKKEWASLKGEKLNEYTSLFETRIKNSYMDKLHLYSDEKVLVEAGVVSGKDRISIPSFILSKEGKTEMVYKFYKAKNGSWLIYDVEIAGVSIVQTFRAQFAEILKTHDVFGLIEKLHGTEKL